MSTLYITPAALLLCLERDTHNHASVSRPPRFLGPPTPRVWVDGWVGRGWGAGPHLTGMALGTALMLLCGFLERWSMVRVKVSRPLSGSVLWDCGATGAFAGLEVIWRENNARK